MQLSVIPFEVGHLKAFTARRFEAREMEHLGNPEAYAMSYLDRGPAWTGVVGEKILGCCGICVFWRGVGGLWLVTGELVNQLPLAFHRAIKYGLGTAMEAMGLWRVQTEINAAHLVSRKWIQRLGFREEGDMPKYGPDQTTYVRYAKVREG